VQLVKGYYERPLHNMPTGGGRVNELAARPILSLLFPGSRRDPPAPRRRDGRTFVSAFEAITLEAAYGVEIALLIDIARQFGVHSRSPKSTSAFVATATVRSKNFAQWPLTCCAPR
jgi:glucosyl-3-phosphoglycerate synthase